MRTNASLITLDDAAIIDEALAQLPQLFLKEGLELIQRQGYKAGRLLTNRNWCEFIDGDVHLPIQFPNKQGQLKTWKLFARFDNEQPLSAPWDQPEKYERKKAQWMLAGDDVWGIAYEGIRDLAHQVPYEQILQRLVKDLAASFDYSRRHYK